MDLKNLAMGPLKAVIDKFIECVDVDGVVRRIHVNEVLERVEMNALLEDIDWDHHLERVDLNRHIERIDVDALLQRVDVNKLVERSNLGSIVAQSTTGVFTEVLDALRRRVVVCDYWLFRLKRLQWRREARVRLPPAPAEGEYIRQNGSEHGDYYPDGSSNMVIVVQGRCCGFFSKALAIFADVMFVTFSFAVLLLILKQCWILFVGASTETASEKVERNNLWVAILYGFYWYVHFFFGILLTGKTLGMHIAGIMLVTMSGSELGTFQALVRTAVLPVSLTFLPFLCVIGLLRRDGRMLHDLVAQTCLIYHGDARMARLREEARLESCEPPQYSFRPVITASTPLIAPNRETNYDAAQGIEVHPKGSIPPGT